MKRIITLISMFLFAGGILMAQTTTPKLSYEVVIRDGDNNLLVDQPVTVDVSVYDLTDETTALYTENVPNLESDANGILIVAFGENVDWQALGVDWMTAKIKLNIDYGSGTIEHLVPVFAVPYALQSPTGELLTTDEIVRYISSINFDNDMRRILKAYHENTYGLENDWVDTFKHYLMSHHEKIKEIILSYAPRITASNIYTTANLIQANTTVYNKGVEVMKEFAMENMDAALEVAKYYIDHYTEEYNADVNSLVNKVEENEDLYPYIKSFFESTFKEYLDEHHYIQQSDCPDFNPCSIGH
jgi:hypothetical protein